MAAPRSNYLDRVSLLLLCGLPLTFFPFLESASTVPKLAIFAMMACALLGRFRLPKEALGWSLLALYGWKAMAPGLAQGGLFELRIIAILFGLVALVWSVHSKNHALLEKGLLSVAAVQVVLGLAQTAGFSPLGYQQMLKFRAMGTLGNPNYLAMFLAPLVILSLPRKGWPYLLTLGLVATGTRAGTVALVLAFLYLAIKESRYRRTVGILVLGLAVGWLGMLGLRPQATERPPDDLQVRKALFVAAEQMIEQSPLGRGPGQFESSYAPFRLLEPEATRNLPRRARHCHNELLGIGVESGLPGILLFLVSVVLAWRRNQDPLTRAAILALGFQLLMMRHNPATETLWLYLLTRSGVKNPEPERLEMPIGIAAGVLGLIWVAPWLQAERSAWLAVEAQLAGRPSLENWVEAWNRAPGLRKRDLLPSLVRAQLLESDRQTAGYLLTEAERSGDPRILLLAAQFANEPEQKRRKLLQASLLDPWNRALYLELAFWDPRWALEKDRLFTSGKE